MPKATVTLPPAEYLCQCFDYDEASGDLRWRRRPRGHFKSLQSFVAWNSRYAGRIAGRLSAKGYWQISVDNRRFYAARIVYKMQHGVDPEWIDHEDRNRTNNTLANLRSATMRQNNRNMFKRAGKGGYIGVHQFKKHWHRKQFFSVIRDLDGKRRYLGSFDTAEEAHEAYRKAANSIFGEFSPFHGG